MSHTIGDAEWEALCRVANAREDRISALEAQLAEARARTIATCRQQGHVFFGAFNADEMEGRNCDRCDLTPFEMRAISEAHSRALAKPRGGA